MLYFPFIVITTDGKDVWTQTMNEADCANHIDHDDDSSMRSTYHHVNAIGEIHPITIGKRERINTRDECPFHFARAPLLLATGEIVGYVTYTDH